MDLNSSAQSNADQSSLSIDSDPPELPLEDRLQLALEVYKNQQKPVSIRKNARMYGVLRTSLQDKIKARRSAKEYHEQYQRLNVLEEKALIDWILRLQAWGWPARVDQVREMARFLLDKKNDKKPLGINWVQKFLDRHPQLKTAFIPPLDKERASAQNRQIFEEWFALFLSVKTEYSVSESNIWNMDEKGFLQGVIGKEKVVISKYQAKVYMTQPGNRELVSLIECVSMDGKLLQPYIIFKGKVQMTAWWEIMKKGHIALSDNGWTNNEIGLRWLQKAFHPETATESNQWRMLLVDGHASHLTTDAIEFCIKEKIILLCLPPHTTHLLQPLDVGVFSPLAGTYKRLVQKKTRLGGAYSIDKCDFLEVYLQARLQAMRSEVIISAWEKAGLSPYNPARILHQFPIQKEEKKVYNVEFRSTTPENATLSYSGPNGSYQVTLTLKNTSDIQQILGEAAQGRSIINALEKVGKAAMLAMAESTIHSVTNAELLALNQRRKAKADRPTASFVGGRIMDHEVLDEREATAATKRLTKEWNGLMRIPVDILQPKKRVTSTPRRQSLHQVNKAFEKEWAGLGRPPEDLFPVKWTAAAEIPVAKKTSAVKKTPAAKKAPAVKKVSAAKKDWAIKKASAAKKASAIKKAPTVKKPSVRKKVAFQETEQQQPSEPIPERFSTKGRLLRPSKAIQASK